jgi:hypothetical protein
MPVLQKLRRQQTAYNLRGHPGSDDPEYKVPPQEGHGEPHSGELRADRVSMRYTQAERQEIRKLGVKAPSFFVLGLEKGRADLVK